VRGRLPGPRRLLRDRQRPAGLGTRAVPVTGVSLDARYAFVSDERGSVHALDRSNGRSVWRQDRLAHRQLSLPAGGAEAVAVGDLEGYVHFLARDSGAFVARYSTGGGAVRVPTLHLAAGVLVQTQGGELYALGL
jgi:outer membrane protein assembly factor BamB